MIRRTVLFFLLALAWCASAAAVAVGPYVLTNLGDLPGGTDQSYAAGINSFGQVVGWSTSSVTDRSFLWQPNVANGTTGSLIDLGSLGANRESYANGINSLGQIVGRSGSDGPNAAYLWTPTSPNGIAGSMSVVGGSPFRDGFNWAYSVNSYGQVVGIGQSDSTQRPFLWTPDVPNGNLGSMLDLNPGGTSLSSNSPIAINSYGQVVMTGIAEGVWSPDTPNGTIGTRTLLPHQPNAGLGVNTRGEVVGAVAFLDVLANGTVVNGTHAALWQPTTANGTTFVAFDLGTLNASQGYSSIATAINSKGEVVGKFGPAGDTTPANPHVFVWTPNVSNGTSGNMFDLHELLNADAKAHWTLTDATAINDLGQIVGNGMFDPDGPGGQPAVPRGYLLTVVPEPQAVVLVGLGLAVVLLGWRPRASC